MIIYVPSAIPNTMTKSNIEIERKFLVDHDKWYATRVSARDYLPAFIKQGYLSVDPACTVRVRITNEYAWLCVKGVQEGISRSEYEFPIPLSAAIAILVNIPEDEIVQKGRYHYRHEGKLWEVDRFIGPNEGLIIAEIELESEEEPFDLPSFVTEEVTHDFRYSNSNLSKKPFNTW